MSEQRQEPGQAWERTVSTARRAGPTWTVGRQQRLRWATMLRLGAPVSRRRRSVVAIAFVGCAAVVALAFFGVGRAPREGAVTVSAGAGPLPSAPSQERLLPRLADGSSVVLDGPTAVLRKTVETPEEVAFQLEAGGAHFEVVRRPNRLFRVHAGLVTVQVIGTRFHVQRQQERARITVDRGRVLVSWWGGSRELGVGEEGTFPPAEETARGGARVRPGAPLQVPTSAVRTPPAVVAPDALFRRADRARAHGQPAEAVIALRQIVDRFPEDPHAPMAAFTIGRLLLESLHRPAEAAQAFAHARALAPGGTVGEDALAREVQALHQAGDTAAARRRAELYLRLFPSGPRVKMVTRFGDLRSSP